MEQKEKPIAELIGAEKISKLENIVANFYQALEQGSSWEGYSEENKVATLKTQTRAILNLQLGKLKIVDDGRIPELVELLMSKFN